MSEQELILAERDYVRGISARFAEETAALERYALVLVSGIWVWALENAGTSMSVWLFLVPALTTMLFGVRAKSIYEQKLVADRHIFELGQRAGLPHDLAWGSRLIEQGSESRVRTAQYYWLALQLITLVVGGAAWLSFR